MVGNTAGRHGAHRLYGSFAIESAGSEQS
mgnify:CR=1